TDDAKGENSSSDQVANSQPSTQAVESDDLVESNDVGINKGQIAPNFKLQTLNGKTVQLSDYKGKRVIVNFWATWCPPCRAEIPDFQKLYEKKD
ncbi:TlpA disulfide reductase family protein, partial [Micrococcus sp. SIMBA_131]